MTTPDSKTQKYDRQLRLWNSHGQEELEQSSVCLIGANNLGTEALKNLILPGIGSFTILDGKVVDGSDAGSNFFLLPSHMGLSRAKSAMTLLAELNDQVKGNYLDKNPSDIIKCDPD